MAKNRLTNAPTARYYLDTSSPPARALDLFNAPRSGYFFAVEYARHSLCGWSEPVSSGEKGLARGRWRFFPLLLPSCDVEKLAKALAERTPDRRLVETRFYAGGPKRSASPRWHVFWANKIRAFDTQGRLRVSRSDQLRRAREGRGRKPCARPCSRRLRAKIRRRHHRLVFLKRADCV